MLSVVSESAGTCLETAGDGVEPCRLGLTDWDEAREEIDVSWRGETSGTDSYSGMCEREEELPGNGGTVCETLGVLE